MRKKLRFLFASGILFGYCALTKGVVGWYMICLVPAIAYFAFRRDNASLPLRARLQHGLTIMVILFGCYGLVVYPQKIANYSRHRVFAISTNTWINIECAVIPYDEPIGQTFERYFKASPELQPREDSSRKRVIEYLKSPSATVPRIVAHQLEQFISQQLNSSFLIRSYQEQRWGDKVKALPYGTIAIDVGIVISWVVFLFGIQGVVIKGTRSFGGVVLLLYVSYYCLSLLVVGWNPRFFVQVMPFLAVFASAAMLALPKPRAAAKKGSSPGK